MLSYIALESEAADSCLRLNRARRFLLRAAIAFFISFLPSIGYAKKSTESAGKILACEENTNPSREEIKSFQSLPEELQREMEGRFKKWDERQAAPSHHLGDQSQMSPRRQLISGGNREFRWFVIYEYTHVKETYYHLVVADINSSTGVVTFIAHLTADIETLCEISYLFMSDLTATGSGMDDNQFW